jgi:hypothetical protein
MSISETMLDLFYTPEPSALRNYTTWQAPDIEATISQTWCRVGVTWERGQTGACAVRLERNLPPEGIDAMGHDQVRFFGAIAPDVVLKLTVNGQVHEFRGDGEPAYHTVPIGADRITALSIEYIPQTSGVGGATLIWLALVQSARDAERLTQRGHYDPSWDGFLLPEGTEPEPRVELGLLFDQDELDALRAKADGPLYRPWMDRLHQQARNMLEIQPESLIGRFAFEPLLYTRPKERKALYYWGGSMMTIHGLAFAGMLDGDLNMLRHAARWMLSVAHCEYWYNDFAGELPGTPWHHRSFTESQVTYQVALGLDWAGSMLTPEGKDLIRDAMARRGLPRMQQDFMDVHSEYIRAMNQGIMFNNGRLMGLLALRHAWPRAEVRLTEAQDDTMEMFSRTFTEDGGTVEGPGYWQGTLAGLPGVIALAKYRNCPAADLLPERMRRAPGYPPVLASTAQTGHALSIGDSHSAPVCPANIAAMLTYIFPGSESERVCRLMPGVGLVRLQIVGAAPAVSGSHSHEDRGNILLEAGGEEILIDRGIGSYSGALGDLDKRPGAHNLLVPDTPDGTAPGQDREHPNDICPKARYQNGRFRATIEPTETWPDHVIRCTRTIDSETPDVFEITDELELTQSLGATLHLHTPCDARKEAAAWVLVGKGVQVLIEPQWPVAEATFAADDLGSGGTAYGHLQLRSAPARSHRLVTRITVQKR